MRALVFVFAGALLAYPIAANLLQQKLEVATSAYDKVHALVGDDPTKHGADVATGATECPVKGFVVFTDDFAELRPGGPHPGIDMGALTGTPVVAVFGPSEPRRYAPLGRVRCRPNTASRARLTAAASMAKS